VQSPLVSFCSRFHVGWFPIPDAFSSQFSHAQMNSKLIVESGCQTWIHKIRRIQTADLLSNKWVQRQQGDLNNHFIQERVASGSLKCTFHIAHKEDQWQ
jgi:hypothetical protein